MLARVDFKGRGAIGLGRATKAKYLWHNTLLEMVSYIWMELTDCLLFRTIPWWESHSIMASDADGLSVTATIYCAITPLILFDFVMTEGVRK